MTQLLRSMLGRPSKPGYEQVVLLGCPSNEDVGLSSSNKANNNGFFLPGEEGKTAPTLNLSKLAVNSNERSEAMQSSFCSDLTPPSSGRQSSGYRKKLILCDGQFHEYEGELNERGLPHGMGTIRWPDGSHFHGRWVEGSPCGHGVSVSAGGTRFDGHFEDGLRHGPGNLIYSDGARYDGTFRRGHRHGQGKLYDPAGLLIFDGRWKRGKPHGRGTCTHPTLGSYSGQWRAGQWHGHGVFTFSDGTVFDGQFDQGLRCGTGVIRSTDGWSMTAVWARDSSAPATITSFTLPGGEILYAASCRNYAGGDLPFASLTRSMPDFGGRLWKERRA